MVQDEKLCSECGHVLMWSLGEGKRSFFRRIMKWSWKCTVGHGDWWSVPPCPCVHVDHVLA